jgi:hypothetical protein
MTFLSKLPRHFSGVILAKAKTYGGKKVVPFRRYLFAT